jgi:sec-independent protein translocase protein TatC
MAEQGLEARLQTLAPSDGFIAYVKMSVLSGIVVACPWIFFHLWQFFAAGPYQHERRFVIFAALSSAFLFISGIVFFIFVIAPNTLRFFIVFNKKLLNVGSVFTFEKHLSFIASMMLDYILYLN